MSAKRTVAEIEDWVSQFLVSNLRVSADAIDPKRSFNAFGLDSSALVGFTDSLGEWLGEDLDPALLYDHPNIHSLARALGVDAGAEA